MKLNTPQPEAVVSFYNLKPNKEYQFRVIAINDVGISPPSADSEFLTTLGMHHPILLLELLLVDFLLSRYPLTITHWVPGYPFSSRYDPKSPSETLKLSCNRF